jgi:hypothetical protein
MQLAQVVHGQHEANLQAIEQQQQQQQQGSSSVSAEATALYMFNGHSH